MYTLVIADGSNESSRATSLDYPESRIPLVNSASDEFVTKGIWAVKTSAASMKSQIVGRGLKVKRVVGGRLGSVIQMPTSVVGGKLGSAFEAFNGIRRRKNSTVAGVASGGRGEGHGGSHTSAQGKEGDEGERDVGREEKSGEGGGERRGLMGLKKAQLLGKFRAGSLDVSPPPRFNRSPDLDLHDCRGSGARSSSMPASVLSLRASTTGQWIRAHEATIADAGPVTTAQMRFA